MLALNFDRSERSTASKLRALAPHLVYASALSLAALLLWGDQDQILDVSSIKVMQPLLKQPSVVIMQACGHLPMIERPEETAEHYQAFLDSVKS